MRRGFTIVELVVIAPIVILAIGAFITVAIQMSGEVLASRAQSSMIYSVQDALEKIQNDVQRANDFLAQNSISVTTTTKQGRNNTGVTGDNDTTAFVNVGASGDTLILSIWATTANPKTTQSEISYMVNSPNPCGTAQTQNTPLNYNVVYFVRTVGGVSSLWKRTLMPSNYATVACNAVSLNAPAVAPPWQRPSCAPGYTTGVFCLTEDEKLVDGVASNGFNIHYYPAADSFTEITGAVSTSNNVAVRNSLLEGADTVSVSINASQIVSGREVATDASIRATRWDYGL